MPSENFSQRLNGKLYRLFVAALLLYAALTCFGPMMNQVDLGWQVAQGRWIVHHIAPYSHDLFNYPNLGRPAINEYPLFEIVLYLAWSAGWWGPCLLAAVAYLAVIIVILRGAQKLEIGESSLLALAMGIMFVYFQVAFPLRPHVITYLGVMMTGVFLCTHRTAAKWIDFWPVALLQIVWTNCHSGFVLGPAMVGLFGAEVTLRRWIRDKSFPWTAAKTWLGAFGLVLLACFINPYGAARFYPPFFQDRLPSIRAYVGEMEPLVGGLATLYGELTLIAIVVVALAIWQRRGAISFAFLLLAVLLYIQAQSINKAWPVFGLFVPLLVMSSAAFTTKPLKSVSWAGVVTLFGATSIAALAVIGRLNPSWDSGIAHQWREVDHGRCEMATEAVAWMKAHHITGRLFHRCEDGGLLQQEGYDHGETFADTGFGKYDEAFIHEVGLVNERPALVPSFLKKYRPDFVVCGNFCYQWPHYLRGNGWRLIFYSPNSSVWTKPGMRNDLPTVSADDIEAAFDRDLTGNGAPNAALLGRNIIALNSLGLEDFAYEKLKEQLDKHVTASWCWEAARILCFETPRFSAEHRDALQVFSGALGLFDKFTRRADPLGTEYAAYRDEALGRKDDAYALLHALPPPKLSNADAELLLKIELERDMPEALSLARRTDCFDLRNGRHWQYLAQAEERWGSLEAAKDAWEKAVFYYPDDDALMQAASDFAAKHGDARLKTAIADSLRTSGP